MIAHEMTGECNIGHMLIKQCRVQGNAKQFDSQITTHYSTSNINSIRAVNATQTLTNAKDDNFSISGVEEKKVPTGNIRCR